MELIEVNSLSEIKAFNRLPFDLYKNDPNWIPHLVQDVEFVFDPKQNKFFRHGKVIRWILKDGNQVVGRVAAFINRKTSKTFKQPTGGMGFFECVNDQNAADILFNACKKWLADRDMEAVDGPVNFGEKDKFWGLITENFDMPPYYGQNYNPEYYVKLFENYGFQVYYNQLIFYRAIADPLQEGYQERAARVAGNPDYECIFIDRKQIEKFAEDFRTIYNRAWVTHESFKGMSKVQAMSILKKVKPILDEKLIYFVYHKGKPVAFYLALPEINEIFKHVRGNLNWWGKVKFLFFKQTKKVKNTFGVAFGVDPDYQGKGVEGFIFKTMEQVVQKNNLYEGIIITWIGDFNPKMISIIESLGGRKIRQMATYRKLFNETAIFERAPIIGAKTSSKKSA